MKVLLPSNRVRVAFLGPAAFEPHVPTSADWAEAQFFCADPRDWDSAIRRAAAWHPEVCVVFAAHEPGRQAVSRLPGLKIGVVAAPVPGPEAWGRLREVATGDDEGFRWLTYFESPAPAEFARLPLLQTLPLPIDCARLPPAVRLDESAILVPEWASPGAQAVDELRRLGPTRMLAIDADPGEVMAALSASGVLVYSSRDLLGRLDPLPMLALAHGLLLVSDAQFPPEWYVEPEDEFLARPTHLLARAVDEMFRMPEAYRAVRVRAWQKVREAFDASPAFKRLLHDAWLFGDVQAHVSRVRSAGGAPALSAIGAGKVAAAS